MKLEENPVFRKKMIPWYDSPIAATIRLLVAAAIFGFSTIGIQLVRETPSFSAFLWVPSILAGLSAILLIVSGFRLIDAFLENRKHREAD
ncbi:hypothetical protein [Desulfatirhabdium butyrativorans]|uniref:hypothetical protein n=1 Tax=Desulfatirhabdium butyrativorans TaxID=340467 RepID=UPI0003FF38BA|nr:hypothetical protein [Desulfatirhabdium butyrativorans]